jgi:hypothetical protein
MRRFWSVAYEYDDAQDMLGENWLDSMSRTFCAQRGKMQRVASSSSDTTWKTAQIAFSVERLRTS